MKTAICYALLLFLVGLAARADESNLIRAMDRAITIDGSLSDWKERPFVPHGYNVPTESMAANVVRTGWTAAGLWIAVKTLEGPAVGAEPSLRRKVDIYIDTRDFGAVNYDTYGPGVYHFRLDEAASPKGCKLALDTNYAGAEDYDSTGCLAAAKKETGGWAVEVFLPWTCIGSPAHAVGTRLGFSVSTSFWLGATNLITLGAKDIDRLNRISKNPMCFSSVVLGPAPQTRYPAYVRAEEVVLQGEPWLLLEAVAEGAAEVEMTVILPGIFTAPRPIKRLRSMGGRFSCYRDWFPLSAAGLSAEDYSATFQFSKESHAIAVAFRTPVARAQSQINRALPVALSESSITAFYRDCALDAACLLSSTEDGITLPQKLIRAEIYPTPIERQWALFLAQASRTSAQRERDWLTHVLQVNSSTADGARVPIQVYYPANFDPKKLYAAQIDVPGLITGRSRLAIASRKVKLAQIENLHVTVGDGFRIEMFGRGNSTSLYGEEELRIIFAEIISKLPIDRSRISLFGESAGCNAALLIAERNPELFSYLHLKSGGQLAEAVRHQLQNLGGMPVFLEAGSEDTACVEVNEVFKGYLEAAGLPVVLQVVAGEGHSYARSEAPPICQKAIAPRMQSKFQLTADAACSFAGPGFAIHQLLNWTKPAVLSVDASKANLLQVSTANIAFFGFKPSLYPRADTISIDGDVISITPENAPGLFFTQDSSGKWSVSREGSKKGVKTLRWSGQAGSVESGCVLLVYGTKQTSATAVLKNRAIEIVKARVGSRPGQIASAKFAIKADVDISEEDIRGNNLWLIGNAAENRATERLLAGAPIKIQPNSVLVGSQVTKGTGILLSTIWPNGEAEERCIYLEAGNSLAAYSARVLPARTSDLTVQVVSERGTKVAYSASWDSEWHKLDLAPAP